MKISFPSAVMVFEVHQETEKDTQGYVRFMDRLGLVIFTAPIQLKVKDRIWIDYRNGNVEVIERSGIAIWRFGWVN